MDPNRARKWTDCTFVNVESRAIKYFIFSNPIIPLLGLWSRKELEVRQDNLSVPSAPVLVSKYYCPQIGIRAAGRISHSDLGQGNLSLSVSVSKIVLKG